MWRPGSRLRVAFRTACWTNVFHRASQGPALCVSADQPEKEAEALKREAGILRLSSELQAGKYLRQRLRGSKVLLQFLRFHRPRTREEPAEPSMLARYYSHPSWQITAFIHVVKALLYRLIYPGLKFENDRQHEARTPGGAGSGPAREPLSCFSCC